MENGHVPKVVLAILVCIWCVFDEKRKTLSTAEDRTRQRGGDKGCYKGISIRIFATCIHIYLSVIIRVSKIYINSIAYKSLNATA